MANLAVLAMPIAPLQGCWMLFGSPPQGVAAELVCCAPFGAEDPSERNAQRHWQLHQMSDKMALYNYVSYSRTVLSERAPVEKAANSVGAYGIASLPKNCHANPSQHLPTKRRLVSILPNR